MALASLKRLVAKSHVLNFNQVERDEWVKTQAERLASGSKVLDVGAGSCPYRALFAHCDYKTQDFKPLADDQLLGGAGYGQIDYVCDATAIPVPDATFDAVLCTEVLEHVPEPARVVAELIRVLKPGGRLILTAPLASGLHQEPFHFYGGFTPHWYKRVLGQLGCTDVHIEPNGGFFKFFGQESIRFGRMTFPFQKGIHPLVGILLLLPWTVSTAVLVGFMPLLCRYLDRFDREKAFTIGYHVVAFKPAQGSGMDRSPAA